MWRTVTDERKTELRSKYVGKKIKIISMDGEPRYTGRQGKVESVDDAGQLHGDWGGLAVNLEVDEIEIL